MPGDFECLDRLHAALASGLDSVTHVLCTHLHFDHVGWNTSQVDGDLVPTFPNAQYLVSADELTHVRVTDEHGITPYALDPVAAAGDTPSTVSGCR